MAETQHEYKNGEKDIEEDFETSEGETEDTSEGKKGIERTSLPEIGEDLSQHEGQNGENHEASLAYMPKDDQHHAEAQPHKVEQTNHERQSSHEEESDKDGKKKESQPSHDRDFGETDDEQARSQQKEPDQSQNHDEHGEKDTNNQAHNEALNLQPESLSQGNPKISDTQPLTPSASSLTNNLSIARPDPVDQAEPLRRDPDDVFGRLAYFCEARHEAGDANDEPNSQYQGIIAKWRQKERLKTTAVALVLCLNIGVDPPDVMKISPCARLQCWIDPLSLPAVRALDVIGKTLQSQYERWQPKAKYRSHSDPTVDDAKKLAINCRRVAKNERVLFHYNGHGVPRPTANGEVWVFNKSYTQYIPLSVYDLQSWVGTPSIYVFDCSAAGLILDAFKNLVPGHSRESMPGLRIEEPMQETLLLAACQAGEMLPQNPELPADVFTACLTTPIKIALKWFCSRSLLCNEGLNMDLIDRLPGKQNDRRTPLGELNWIFTAVTDTIAWNTLPRALFQKLFRQDLLVASLFRNFLLAERIMRGVNCSPVSHPRLPATHQHPMWQAWDRAAEMSLIQIPAIVKSDGALDYTPGPFFTEQLTAFELWLQHGSKDKSPPEQLPIVLQVLLSQNHRLRALWLLGSFLDMGPWAVDLALSVGIFPYVLKLLQTSATDLRETLIFIWTKILALDPSCYDLVKDNGHLYFIKYLNLREVDRPKASCAQAAFVLATICSHHPNGQHLCTQGGLLETILSLLSSPGNQVSYGRREFQDPETGLLVKWLCLCFGKLVNSMPEIISSAIDQRAHDILVPLLNVSNPEVRGSAVFALGSLIQGERDQEHMGEGNEGHSQANSFAVDRALACHLFHKVYDASPLVRAETALALTRLALGHNVLFQDAVSTQQRQTARAIKHAKQVSGNSSQGAHSAPDNSSSGNMLIGQRPLASSQGQSMEKLSFSNGKLGSSESIQSSASPVETAPLATSPNIFVPEPVIRRDRSVESSISGQTTPDEPHSSFASADAARVGGGMYTFVLEALCTLATDPTKIVQKMGQTALRAAGVELQPVIGRQGIHASKSSSQLTPLESANSAQLPHDIPSAFSTTHLPAASSSHQATGSRWHPRNLLTKSARSLNHPSAISTPASSPTTSLQEVSQRAPFVLRQVHNEGGATPMGDMSRQASSHSAISMEGTDPHSQMFRQQAGNHVDLNQGYIRPPWKLPESPTIKAATRYFAEPLADRAIQEWQSLGHSTGYGAPHYTIKAQWQPWRVESRLQDRNSSIASLKSSMQASELKIRVEQVESFNTESPGSVRLLLHPFRPIVILVDGIGVVRVYNSRKPNTLKNCFYISSGDGVDLTQKKKGGQPQPASVVAVWQINELFNGLLLSGAADGAVRVWRDYTFPRTQTLATGWQAVQISQARDAQVWKTVYEWQEETGCLFAAGGSQPSMIHKWDLQQELCLQKFNVGEDQYDRVEAVSHLAASKTNRHNLLTVSGGSMRIFDLRSSSIKPASSLRLYSLNSLVGLVYEPGGLMHRCVTAHSSGELQFLDFRMIGDSDNSAGILKTVQAHSRENLTAVAGHPHAPLIATGTASQVIKLWSATGEQRAVVRTQTPLLNSQRVGPITCLQFHPHRALLASGSADSLVTLYPIESSSGAEQTSSSETSQHSTNTLVLRTMSGTV